jgi:hypothetical protein
VSDRSRRPHHHPATTDPEVVDQLVAARHRFPHWSAAKLITWLRKGAPRTGWPGRTTAYELLRRQGLSQAQPRRRVRPPLRTTLQPAHAANDLWTTDFKGAFRLGNGAYCHPLTLRDAASRFVLRGDSLTNQTAAATQRCFARAFREDGLPQRSAAITANPLPVGRAAAA